jgi:hypothetical protein
MHKAAPFALILGMIIIACSSMQSANVDAGPKPAVEDDAALDDGANDAAPGANDAAPICETAKCESQEDCQKALGGIAGCWQCRVGCCIARPSGQDPDKACIGLSSACVAGVCDGNGGCSKTQFDAGAACGIVCSPNKTYQKVEARCDGRGICSIDFLGSPSFSNCATGSCVGASDSCGSCPPGGCAVTCADAGKPSCP